MTRYPSRKLPKQSNKKIGRSFKHKTSDHALERKEKKAERQEAMETGSVTPVVQRTAEEKAIAKAARQVAGRQKGGSSAWKKMTGNVNTTARNGPRAVH
jgi:hypothetical protein